MVDDNGDYSDTVYSRRGYCGTLCWRPYLDVSHLHLFTTLLVMVLIR
jgi:hypothetical protein